MHALLMDRADALMGCTGNSPEEVELAALTDAVEEGLHTGCGRANRHPPVRGGSGSIVVILEAEPVDIVILGLASNPGALPTETPQHEAGCNLVTAMRARQLIDAASFGPDALAASSQACDAAWADIVVRFGTEPSDVQEARYKLATALLSIASEDSRDVEVLMKAALQRKALDYRVTTPTYYVTPRSKSRAHY